MSFVRLETYQELGRFLTPVKGVWKSIAASSLPADALSDSLNVFLRKGKVRERPGLSLLNSSVFEDVVLGGGMLVDTNGKTLLAITRNRLYILQNNSSSWLSNSINTFALTNDDVIDIAYTVVGNNVVALIANRNYQLKQWSLSGGVSTITPIGGTLIPYAKSVCISARRVVCLVDPHTLVWSSTLTTNSFPSLATAIVARTNDVGICVRPIGSLGFVLYKERSIYPARSQAGSDANAFYIDEPKIVEGPAGVHAVVVALNRHFYMTKNGRIAMYDGINDPQWIADGLWFFLQDDIDSKYSNKIFGVFDYRLNTLIFYYPRIGDMGLLKGMVMINLPFEGVGIFEKAAFLGLSSKPCSFGYEMRFDDRIDRSVIFTSTSNDCQSFILDENVSLDDGESFTCSLQTPLIAMPEQRYFDVLMDIYLERSSSYGFVNAYPVVSDVLDNENGTVQDEKYKVINLNTKTHEYISFDTVSRFFGLRLEWSSTSKIRYAGSVVYGSVRQ